MTSVVAERVEKIAAEFGELDPRERLELLLEFSENLPPLPSELVAERDAGMNRVVECQTPVFVWVRLVDGDVSIHADVAPEAPTVKGFVSVLCEIFSGATAEDVLATEPNLVHQFGLVESLGMQRMRGLQAILHYIRRKVAAAAEG